MNIRLDQFVCPLAFLTLILFEDVLSAEVPFPGSEKLGKSFAAMDSNADQLLSHDEFLANRRPREVLSRDFLLFDRDANGSLTLLEFASIPHIFEGIDRGPVPDPVRALLEKVIADVDNLCGDWNENPEVEIEPQKVKSIRLRARSGQDFVLDTGSADFDGTGRVSRNEMRRFVEHQLGICRGDGELLRHPDGRVVNYIRFVQLDQDQDDRIQRTDYVKQANFAKDAGHEFDAGDRDGDGTLTFDEWSRFPDRGTGDPIEEFRTMDTNLDAFVSQDELVAGTVEEKKPIAKHEFPAFDLDHDGRLSLAEYQLTPQANPVLPWDQELWDLDSDGLLSFGEFKFTATTFPDGEADQFPQLRHIYFCQYDVNADGKLDPDEYNYRRKIPNEIFSLNEDGTDWKSILKIQDHPMCGSVAVSPDGKRLAFEAAPQNELQHKALFVVEFGSNQPRRLCDGMMPTWSTDGKFLAFTRSAAQSIWLLDLATNKEESLAQGWGAQWSPDGRKISWFAGTNIQLFDIVASELVTVLTQEQHPYQRFFWNMSWSPDSRQLCFKGLTADNKQEMATVDLTAEPPKINVRHSGTLNLNADSAWHPDGNRVVFSTLCAARGVMQLYEFNPDNDDAPTLVKGQDEKRNNLTCCWTPDGRRLIVTSGDF